jgi:hypothetical protein
MKSVKDHITRYYDMEVHAKHIIAADKTKDKQSRIKQIFDSFFR